MNATPTTCPPSCWMGRGVAAEDDPARLDADHDVDPLALVPPGEIVDDGAERGAVLQQGRDVLEEDSLGGKVLDVTDLCPQLGQFHGPPSYRLLARPGQARPA